MTLRDASQKKCKSLVGGAWWLFLLPTLPTRTFAPLTRRLSFRILPLGTRLRSRAPPVICWAGAGSTGGCHRRRSHPTTPNKVMHVLFKESEAATPHIQEHHQSLANCLLANLRYLCFIKQSLSDMWGIFLCLVIRMPVLNK